jgi:hypothetical protein
MMRDKLSFLINLITFLYSCGCLDGSGAAEAREVAFVRM